MNSGSLGFLGVVPAVVCWFAGGGGAAASNSCWMRISVAICFLDAFFYVVSFASDALAIDGARSCSCVSGGGWARRCGR